MCLIYDYLFSNGKRREVIISGMRLRSILHYLLHRSPAPQVNTTPHPGIELERYMGRWYEQARFENWFESGMDFVHTDYTLGGNGSVTIVNTGKNSKGTISSSRGKAILHAPGKLAVSFVPPYGWFRVPYHILYVDTDYRTALVSGQSGDYLWLLSREPDPARELLQPLLEEAQQRGFNTAQLRYTKQNC